MFRTTMRPDLILLLTLSIISIVFAISGTYAGPLESRYWVRDPDEAASDFSAFDVEQHQAFSAKPTVAPKHGGDDVLKNDNDAVPMSNSNSKTYKSRLIASAIRSGRASLEEDLRIIVKLLGQMIPGSFFEMKEDVHEFQVIAPLQSSDEHLRDKPLRLRCSDENSPRRSLKKTYDQFNNTDWIIFWISVSPVFIGVIYFGILLSIGYCPYLQSCCAASDPIPASTEPPHEVQPARRGLPNELR